MVKLDTRASRDDLTSRECAKLICGIIGGAVAAGIPSTVLRQIVKGLSLVYGNRRAPSRRDAEQYEHEVQLGVERAIIDTGEIQKKLGLDEIESRAVGVACTLLGALIGSLQHQSAPGALGDALQWISEYDDVWHRFEAEKAN